MESSTTDPTEESIRSSAPLHRAALFVLLTFGLAMTLHLPVIAADRGWLAVAVPATMSYLGVFSPAVAALILVSYERGRAGVRLFVQQATRKRLGTRWWLATVLVPPIVLGTSYATYLLLGGEFQVASALEMLRSTQTPAVIVFPLLVLLTIALAFGEEAGWRGYLLPLLQARWSALTASLILGVIWFLWHVPLLYLPGTANAGFPLSLWAVSITLSSITYTWLYNNTAGSVLAVTLFHAGFNVWGRLIALHPSETGELLSAFVMTAGNAVVALGLVLVYGGATLTRSRPVQGKNKS